MFSLVSFFFSLDLTQVVPLAILSDHLKEHPDLRADLLGVLVQAFL